MQDWLSSRIPAPPVPIATAINELPDDRRAVQAKRRPVDHSDDSDDDANSLRDIVARETRKLAKLAKAADAADAREARRVADHNATAQAVADQGPTVADLQEGSDA